MSRIKKLTKTICAVTLAAACMFTCIMADGTAARAAKSVSQLQKEQDELEDELDDLDAELVDLMTSINEMEADISDLESEIAENEEELQTAEASRDEQYADMKKRMQYSYESGSTDQTTLEMLITSGSIASMLDALEYADSVYDYDKQMVDNYKATVEEISELLTELDSQKAELESQKASLESKKSELNTMIANKKKEIANYDTMIAKAKAAAAKKAAEERARKQAEAAAKASQQIGSGTGNTVSTTSSVDVSNQSGSSNPGYKTGVSGSAVVSYARSFVGVIPYVWGGTSLSTGCDCSGFVWRVFEHFGVSLGGSRPTSASLRSVGSAVSIEYIQPGDIVCYAGHVAIYAGGGVIVEAQSTRAGITCGRAVNCKTILAIRRVL